MSLPLFFLLLRAGLSAAPPRPQRRPAGWGPPRTPTRPVLPHQVPLHSHCLFPMGLGPGGAMTVSLSPWGAQGLAWGRLCQLAERWLCAWLCPSLAVGLGRLPTPQSLSVLICGRGPRSSSPRIAAVGRESAGPSDGPHKTVGGAVTGLSLPPPSLLSHLTSAGLPPPAVPPSEPLSEGLPQASQLLTWGV